MSATKALTLYTAAFVDELVNSGVTDAVISPGSRSTPMSLTMAEHPGMNVWLQIDERSAGFFALGIAKARQKPVALVCTSGTAAANYMPAVVEAYLSRVPLIVITTDRPHELRDVGAPQAIDQNHLFGNYAKWFVEMALPEESASMLRYVRSFAGRAAATAMKGPSGVVHLNFPFREPLIPDFNLNNLWNAGKEDRSTYIHTIEGKRQLEGHHLSRLAAELKHVTQGLFVCGPHDEPELAVALTALAAKLQFPVLADPLSQLRTGHHDKSVIIDGYDAFLKVASVKKRMKPEVIIRFGAMPVSKAFLQYVQEHPEVRQIVVDEDGGWREPTQLASEMIYTNAALLCQQLIELVPERDKDDEWLRKWKQLNEQTQFTINSMLAMDHLFEGKVFRLLEELMPTNSQLFVGNSMPIRDLDSFYRTTQSSVKVMANRGANGIDGIVSTALGAAAVSEPLVLVLGDLSFYHDLNGLLAAKLHSLHATIIVLNNDGGGIFSFLPQAQHPTHFEALFGTPLGLDYQQAVEMYGGSFTRISNWQEFKEAVSKSVQSSRLSVIEVPTNRQQNEREHREIWAAVAEAVNGSEQ